MMTGHPFKGGEFPDEARFDSNQELFQWFKWVQRQLWKNEPMSNALPCFRLVLRNIRKVRGGCYA